MQLPPSKLKPKRKKALKPKPVAYYSDVHSPNLEVAGEILVDCGTNFVICLMQELYKLMGVKGIKTTSYHPESDDMIDRFKSSLKTMIRKTLRENVR